MVFLLSGFFLEFKSIFENGLITVQAATPGKSSAFYHQISCCTGAKSGVLFRHN